MSTLADLAAELAEIRKAISKLRSRRERLEIKLHRLQHAYVVYHNAMDDHLIHGLDLDERLAAIKLGDIG